MTVHEAKLVAFGAAANIAVDYPSPGKAQVAAAITYLCGKTERAAFIKKCAKNPLYARLVFFNENGCADYGAESFAAAHKSIFDGETGCGEIRTGELTLTGGSCADPKLLRGSLKNVLTKLQQIPSAPDINKADFATQLCCYLRELIILSPFAFGNGVVRRAFVQSFCLSRGFVLNYSLCSKEDITAAETEAFASDAPQPLFLLLVKCLSYLQEETSVKPTRRTRAELAMPERKSVPHKTEPEVKKPPERIQKPPKKTDSVPPPKKQNELPQAKKPEQPKKNELPQAKRTAKNDRLGELKEIRAALEQLTRRVDELIKSFDK